MSSPREVTYSPWEQGADERVIHTFDFAAPANGQGVVTAPSSATIAVFDVTGGARTDVTATVMPTNSPSIASSVVTASPLRDLTAGQTYRVECLGVGADGQREELYLVVKATY